MAVEAKRGCGFRKTGGLYLVGVGLSTGCDRLPFPLDRCRTCGGGIKFTRGHTWLQPDFFTVHIAPKHPLDTTQTCLDESPCPVCNRPPIEGLPVRYQEFGPHLLLWIGRSHYTPEEYLRESRELGVSRRIPAMPKGMVLGETWVLLAHLDAVPPNYPNICARCRVAEELHKMGEAGQLAINGICDKFEAPKPTPGIFCAFVPRAVELILKQSDATSERVEKEAKRGVTVVAVPDDDRDHQGSVWDAKDEEQPELPGVALPEANSDAEKRQQ